MTNCKSDSFGAPYYLRPRDTSSYGNQQFGSTRPDYRLPLWVGTPKRIPQSRHRALVSCIVNALSIYFIPRVVWGLDMLTGATKRAP